MNVNYHHKLEETWWPDLFCSFCFVQPSVTDNVVTTDRPHKIHLLSKLIPKLFALTLSTSNDIMTYSRLLKIHCYIIYHLSGVTVT